MDSALERPIAVLTESYFLGDKMNFSKLSNTLAITALALSPVSNEAFLQPHKLSTIPHPATRSPVALTNGMTSAPFTRTNLKNSTPVSAQSKAQLSAEQYKLGGTLENHLSHLFGFSAQEAALCSPAFMQAMDNNNELKTLCATLGKNSRQSILVLNGQESKAILKGLFAKDEPSVEIQGTTLNRAQCFALAQGIWAAKPQWVQDSYRAAHFNHAETTPEQGSILIASRNAIFQNVKNVAETTSNQPTSNEFSPANVDLGAFDMVGEYLGAYAPIGHVEVLKLDQTK